MSTAPNGLYETNKKYPASGPTRQSSILALHVAIFFVVVNLRMICSAKLHSFKAVVIYLIYHCFSLFYIKNKYFFCDFTFEKENGSPITIKN